MGCVCFTSWKGIQCFIKYLDSPTGTILTIEPSLNHQFPAITVCADPKIHKESMVFNKEKLKDCNIYR